MITSRNENGIQLGVVQHLPKIRNAFRLCSSSFNCFHGQREPILIDVANVVQFHSLGTQRGIGVSHSATCTDDPHVQVTIIAFLSGNSIEHPRGQRRCRCQC